MPVALWPALATRIAQQAGADVLDLRHLSAAVAGTPNPLFDSSLRQTAYATHSLSLQGSWETFRNDRLSSSHRATSRRKWRQLHKLGTPRFVDAQGVDEALSLLSTILSLKRTQCADSGRRDLLAMPGYADFFREMTRRHFASGRIRITALQIDRSVLAAHWGCVHQGRFLWLMPTYDPAWQRVSPGRLLLEQVLERSFEEGLDAFDFTIGDEPYKLAYADTHERLGRAVHARTPLGHAYAWRACREGLPPKA